MLVLVWLVLVVPTFLSHLSLLHSLRSFFLRLGSSFENQSSYWERRSGSFFVVYGHQRTEDDVDQLFLTDKLLQAVFAKAQVVCIGQLMLIAGDLNADPAVIPFPVLLRVFLLVGLLTWLWRILVGLVLHLTLLVGSVGRVPGEVVLALRNPVARSFVNDF